MLLIRRLLLRTGGKREIKKRVQSLPSPVWLCPEEHPTTLLYPSSYAFSGVAKQIPKKSPKFYAFQRQVEERVKNLTFSGITLQGSREHVDNTTPDYTGKTVFSIEASKAPGRANCI